MHLEAGQKDEGLAELVTRIEALEHRVQQLEHGAPVRSYAAAKAKRSSLPLSVDEVEPEKDLALLGRSLIAIGGAFLLRALTESAVLPQLAGVVFGVVYAFAWMWMADRQAQRGESHGATFSAAVAAIIVFPLTWEVAIRFELIPAAVGLVLLVAATASLLYLGWRRNLAGAAWIGALGAPPCAAALALGFRSVSAPMIVVALIAAATWWVARERSWTGLGWPPALSLAAMAGAGSIIAANQGGQDAPELVALALCAAFLVYAGGIGARPLTRHSDTTFSDLIAFTPAVVATVAGAAYLTANHAAAPPAVPLLIGCAAIFAYVVALKGDDAIPIARSGFATIGIVCAICSTAIVLTPASAGLLWALFGAAGAIVGTGILLEHGAAYAVAAVIASGLLGRAFSVLSGIGGPKQLTLFDAVTIVVVTTTSVAATLRRGRTPVQLERMARLTLLGLSSLLVSSAVAALLVGAFAAHGAAGATARSAAIASVAVALVFIARLRPLAEVSLLVYPLLCVGAAKFVTDDFIGGRAATLFVTLAIYGVALLIVARFRRNARLISV